MKVSDLDKLEGFRVLNLYDKARQTEITGCYVSDLLSWVMAHAKASDVWITIMGHNNIIAVATLTEVAAVIVAEGEQPEEETLKTAEEKGVIIVSSAYPIYETAKLLAEAGI